MDKKSNFRFSQNLTGRCLVSLVVFSFICTLLGFGTAYNEHRYLSDLSDKYNKAIESLEACEESVSELSEKIELLQTTLHREEPDYPEEFITDKNTENDIASATRNNEQNTVSPSQKISDSKYYVTQSGSKYHTASCSYLSKSRICVSAETIRAKGYTPCSRCIK